MQPTFFWPIYDHPLKVAFFKKCDSFFKSPKKIFQKIILSLKFKFPANNSKQQIQAQDSNLEYFFWRFEKRIALSE